MKRRYYIQNAESLTFWEWLVIFQEVIRHFNEKETYLNRNYLSEKYIKSKRAINVERVLEDRQIEGVDVDVEHTLVDKVSRHGFDLQINKLKVEAYI